MKRLILHIGYPKTATTTLQEGVFLNLHKQGLINYLGRTVSSTHRLVGKDIFQQDWVVDFRRHFALGEKLHNEKYVLSNLLVNVISDEDLTFPRFFNYARFGARSNPVDIAKEMCEILKDADDVKILMTIRNQAELIPSSFIQKYKYIHLKYPGFSFSDFLKGKYYSGYEASIENFNFLRMAGLYKEIFNGEVVPVIFEDLKHDKFSFFNKLAGVLNVDHQLISSLVDGKHFRNRKQVSHKGLMKVQTLSNFGRIISSLPVIGKPSLQLANRGYLRKTAWLRLERKLLFRDAFIPIPQISERDKTFISEYFKESNAALADRFKMDISKLKTYGYL